MNQLCAITTTALQETTVAATTSTTTSKSAEQQKSQTDKSIYNRSAEISTKYLKTKHNGTAHIPTRDNQGTFLWRSCRPICWNCIKVTKLCVSSY